MKRLLTLMLAAAAAAAQAVLAEDAKPAREAPELATTVTGQQETPLGLYIVPWRNSDAEGGADKPARLLDEALLPHDSEVFHREIQYNRALSEHLEKEGKVTP